MNTTQEVKLTTDLPQVISDVKRAYKGYRVLSNGGWKFYAAECLDEAQVDELNDWLEEVRPVKKAV